MAGRTEVLRSVRAEASDPAIQRAAALLRRGKLVAFPTETVYGLGARVGDEVAVRQIFAAKGRPANVPLIVHVSDLAQAERYVVGVAEAAARLAHAHWPGPLTLVMERSALVPDAVTAGGDTVGVRAPAHPVALALIEALGEGIAAPSANMYNRLPPVRAEHVLASLDGRIDAVLDGGRCPGGLESTVVDVRSSPFVVLRRGAVDVARLSVDVRENVTRALELEAGAWIRVGDAQQYEAQGFIGERVGRMRIGVAPASSLDRTMPADPAGYAAEMYDALHALWTAGCDCVWVDAPPRDQAWEPIWDRLARLSSSLSRNHF
jgi:L-threonylcarbamoyladenylate synthase